MGRCETDLIHISNYVTESDKNFLRLEYQCLRDEIIGLKSRVIKEFSIGLTAIPVILGAGYSADIIILLILSPVIVVAGFLMLVFEQNSIMRAGAYIGSVIEPCLLDDDTLGWEYWLETGQNTKSKKRRNDKRRAERYFHTAALIAFMLYYIVGTYLAFISVPELKLKDPYMVGQYVWGAYVLLCVYLIIFFFAFRFIHKNLVTNSNITTCKLEMRSIYIKENISKIYL